MEVKLGDKTLGQHGSNIYYKEFFVTTKTGTKCYRPGRFYFVQKSNNFPVTIAEFQLIWHSLKDDKNYASVKLYFKPDVVYDENEYEPFGKDEVVEASRQVVVECCEFPLWECSSKNWHKGVGNTVYNGVQLDKLKSLNRAQHTIIQKDSRSVSKVKIISFPQYCRYKSCLQMLKVGVPMTYFELLSRGGLDIKNLNTIILFSKQQFEKDDVEDFSPTEDISVPVFKGRPRKRKNNDISSSKISKKRAKIEKDPDWDAKTSMSSGKCEKKAFVNDVAVKKYTPQTLVCSPPPPEPSAFTTTTKAGNVRGRDTVSHHKRESTMQNKEEHCDFSKDLHDFMVQNGTPILKIPRIGCAQVDPLVMYRAVIDRGGYRQVTYNRQWRNVYDCLGHSTMITNAATATRKSYERMLLPYERYLSSGKQDSFTIEAGKKKESSSVSQERPRRDSDIITPRETAAFDDVFTKGEEPQVTSPDKVITVLSDSDSNPESLSISLMMSKQRGRPSKKFRNQIEKLRTKQSMKLEEEMQSTTVIPMHANFQNNRDSKISVGSTAAGNINNKQYRHFPRKQTWVNDLNVDIVNASSRKNAEAHSAKTSPVLIRKEKQHEPRVGERKRNGSSDVELISPRPIEVHSQFRQGRRLYSSSKDVTTTSNGTVDNFVPILPRTAKPPPQPVSAPLRKEFCEFKIQSVRSLASADEPKLRPAPPLPAATKSNVLQYMHYPYSTTEYDYIPTGRQYYSLSDGNKLIPVTLPEHHRNNNKGAFRDSGFSMRTFRNEQHPASPENNSYKIKSAALKNHEPYIIHHPAHVNRSYGGGQYPVLYTHHPGRFPGKNQRTPFRHELPPVHKAPRFIAPAQMAQMEIREFNHPGYPVVQRYENIAPRVEKIGPRVDKVSPRGVPRGPGYLQYIEDPTTKVRLPTVSVACNM